jgi:hypothetical protein
MLSEIGAESNDTLLIGFIVVVEREDGSCEGSYLCTDQCGAPVECWYTSPIKPTRSQKLLYGAALEPQLLGRCIAGALLKNIEHKPAVVLTDREVVSRSLAEHDFPELQVTFGASDFRDSETTQSVETPMGTISLRWLGKDAPRAKELVGRLCGLDLKEPFQRVKNVLDEIRKDEIRKKAPKINSESSCH